MDQATRERRRLNSAKHNAVRSAAAASARADRTCANPACGSTFTPKRADGRYCSTDCGRRARYAATHPEHEHVCAWCTKTFTSTFEVSTYCSPRCRSADRHVKNRTANIARAREWAKANPARAAMHAAEKLARRRARKAAAGTFRVTVRDQVRLVRRQDGRCAYCGFRAVLTLDHVVPLSRGGAHAVGNLAMACGPCNYSKSDKLLVEWRQYLARGA